VSPHRHEQQHGNHQQYYRLENLESILPSLSEDDFVILTQDLLRMNTPPCITMS
jgi:hypothetical protein